MVMVLMLADRSKRVVFYWPATAAAAAADPTLYKPLLISETGLFSHGGVTMDHKSHHHGTTNAE